MGNNSTTTAVSISGLRVDRGGATILPELDLEIPRGTIVGLLGPSGSGKTTLMRSIVGVQIVASGTVTVLGRPAGHPALRRVVGYTTQEASVYADLTVSENLRYFAAMTDSGADDISRAVAQVDLADKLDQRVATLSGGELSRASLAATLVGAPELLVLDEPTVGLDPVLRRDLWRIFGQLRDSGATLLVSSHVMDEATRCDRILLLHRGRVLADETPAGLLARTGAASHDEAFLALVDGAAGEAA